MIDPREKTRLRKFGLTVGIAFLILTALLFWKQRAAWPYCGVVGLLLLGTGLIWPLLLRPIEKVWMKAAGYLGWFMTRVILGLVFLIIFTPAGLIIRLLRRDPMDLRIRKHAPSYWHRRSSADSTPERMERMF